MKKKIFAGLLTFVMAFSSVQTYAFAEEDLDEILTDLEEVEEKEEEELLGTSEDVRYKVTLDAGEGSFVIEEDEEVSKVDIYVTKGDVYDNSVRYLEPDGSTEDGEYVRYDELPIPEREGYDFFCWYQEEEHDDILLEEYVITGDKEVIEEDELTFYAIWKEKETAKEDVEEPEESDEDTAPEEELLKAAADAEGEELEADADKKASEDELTGEELAGDELDAEGKELTEGVEGLEAAEASEELGGVAALLGGAAGDTQAIAAGEQEAVGDAPAEVRQGEIWIQDIPDKEYTTQAITIPNLEVYHNRSDNLLTLGKDYTVAYKNNKNVGSATITVTLKGNFTGKLTKNFNIVKNVVENPGEITAIGPVVVANDKLQKGVPEISIKVDDKAYKLKNGTDFTCTYPGTDPSSDDYDPEANPVPFTDPGDYVIHVNGKGNFEFSCDVTQSILPKGMRDINKAKVTFSAKYGIDKYGDDAVVGDDNITLVVNYGGENLKKNVDYTQSDYEIENGQVKCELSGINKYYGTKLVTCTIAGTPINKAVFVNPSSVYDGEPKSQILTFAGVEGNLEEGKHYTVEYAPEKLLNGDGRPVNVGTVTATYTGINGFTGTVKKSFKITPFNLANAGDSITAELTKNTFPYSKNGVLAKVNVKYGETNLVEGRDYSLVYANNKAINGKKAPTVTVKGKGNFTGALAPIPFAIEVQNINAEGITLTAADKVYAYKAGNYTTSITITDVDGKKLIAGTDYDKNFKYYYAQDVCLLDGRNKEEGDMAASSDIVPANTLMKVKVTGNGSYTGYIEKNYRIVTADIGKASISVANQYYTGSDITPDKSQIQVRLGGTILVDEDYAIVGYENNRYKGKAKIYLAGQGDYGGSKMGTFTIENATANFTVLYNANGATSGKMNKQTSQPGKAVNLVANKFVRPGFDFAGWDTEKKDVSIDDVTAEYHDRDQIDAEKVKLGVNIVLYAHWVPKTYSITWHLNGGVYNPDTPKPNNYLPTTDSFSIEAPKKTDWKPGYQFGGWYTDPAYKNRISYVKKGSYGDIDLYAKWVPYTYKVIFDGNGATKGSMSKQTFSYGVAKPLAANKFSKAGYAFAGWTDDYGNFYDDKCLMTGILDLNADPAEFSSDFDQEIILSAVWKDKFDISYTLHGGVLPVGTEYDYELGQKYSLPIPSKTGYTFGGWYTEEIMKNKLTSITAKTAGNLNLYAKWTPNTYTVIFNKNDASATGKMANQTLAYGETTRLNENAFVKKGYSFKGFSLEADGSTGLISQGDEPLNLTTVNKDKVTVYAQWDNEPVEYSIVYKTNGGIVDETYANYISSYVYNHENGYDLPVPTKDGDEFGGWYLDSQFKKKIGRISASDYGNLELHALWLNDFKSSYKIKFYADAPEGTSATGKMADQKMNYGVAKAISANKYSIKGYSFVGWSIIPLADRTDEVAEYEDKNVVTGFISLNSAETNQYQKEVKLYAVWEKDTYTVTLCNVNVTNDIEDAVPFFTYNVDEEIVFGLTRISAPAEQKFIGDDGEEADENGKRYLAEPYKLGDTFLGWYSDSKYKKKVTSIPKGSTGNKTFYARWETTRYTINYDLNAGYDPTVELDTENAGYVTNYMGRYESGYLLATASRKHFTFGGWYKEKACKNPVGNIIGSPYVDMTVYAKWIPGTFRIEFDKNNVEATGEMKPMVNLKTDQKYRLTRNGFLLTGRDFVKWSTKENPNEDDLTFDDGASFDAEALKAKGFIIEGGCVTLYAQWKLHDYTVKYHLDGGTNDAANPTAFTMEDELVTLREPTKPGYVFVGWYRDAKYKDLVEPVVGTTETYAIPEGTVRNLDFYAKWRPTSFTVIFDSNDDSATGVMENKEYYNISQQQTLPLNKYNVEGKEFMFWSLVRTPAQGDPAISDGTTFYPDALKQNGDHVADGDVITLYAQWRFTPYQIRYHLFGGSNDYTVANPNPDYYDASTEIVALVDPVRGGSTFLGWYRDAAYTNRVVSDPEDPGTYAIREGTTGVLDFYAKWQIESMPEPEESDRINVVERYGVDNTGNDDATDGINRAISKARENYGSSRPTTVYIPAGTYKISINDSGKYKTAIQMENHVTLYMDENAVLNLVPESNSSDVCAISFINRNDAHIVGGKLVGAGTESTKTDRYGIWIKGCTNISISDMEVSGMQCDGFYISPQQMGSGTPAENAGNSGISIINCKIHNNRRNNISIVDCDNLFIGSCEIYNAGNRSPHCGICIEPNDDCSGDGVCTDIYIKDTNIRTGKSGSNWEYRTFYTYNNHGSYPIARDVTIENCYLEGYYGNYNGKNIKLINTTIVGTKDG